MQLKIDMHGWNLLTETIECFYKKKGRWVEIFRAPKPNENLEFCFLIDRKYVAKYLVGEDRNLLLGALLLGVGPEYFSPAQLWGFENSLRFKMEATTEAVEHNLTMLDEFLGSKSVAGC